MGSAVADIITIESDDDEYSRGNTISEKVAGCYIKFQLDDSGQLRSDNSKDDNSCLGKMVVNKTVNSILNVNGKNELSSNAKKAGNNVVQETYYNGNNEALDTNSEESNNSTEAIKDKDNTIYECEDCNKKFTKKNSLLKHEKIHGLETFECDRCNKCFSQYASLQIHKQTHPPLECLQCYEVFSSQKDLKEHEESHIQNVPKRRNSSNSNKSVKSTSQLNKFKCNNCKWECKNFNRLRRHSMKSHKILIFYCNFCNKLLNSKDENEKHKGDCPKRIFQCRNCLKRFPYDTALKRHRLTCEKKNSESQTEDLGSEPEEMEIID